MNEMRWRKRKTRNKEEEGAEERRAREAQMRRRREREKRRGMHACITSPDLRFRNQRHNLGVLISGGCQHERK